MVKKEGNAGGNPTDKLVPRVLPNTWKAQNWRKKILKSAKLREVTKPIDKRYLSKITEFITNNSVILYQPWWEILKVWSSKLSKRIKIQLFRATTETILLYGSSTWTLTKQEEKALDGTYTRMLRKVLNIGWNEKISNITLYGSLSKITNTIKSRRLKLAGHVFRDKTSPAHLTVTWMPSHGYANRGKPKTTFVDTLLTDTSSSTIPEFKTIMSETKLWISYSRCQKG